MGDITSFTRPRAVEQLKSPQQLRREALDALSRYLRNAFRLNGKLPKMRAIAEGAASMFSLTPAPLPPMPRPFARDDATAFRMDAEAIRRDWETVGRDLAWATNQRSGGRS